MGTAWKIAKHLSFLQGLFLGITCAHAAAQEPAPPGNSQSLSRDFAGRTLAPVVREFMPLTVPPQARPQRVARMPAGWTQLGHGPVAAGDFSGNPAQDLWDKGLTLEFVTKRGVRVGLIRKLNPDRSSQITDIFHLTAKEDLSEVCNPSGHEIPAGYLLLGVMNKGDPH